MELELELNLETIKLMGRKKEKENLKFRSYLKSQKTDKVDPIAHRISKEVTAAIDCTTCGNCCRTLRPSVSTEELVKLTKLEKMPIEDYISDFTERIDDTPPILFLKAMPCRYLENKKCRIYANRPEDCRTYPNLDKEGFNKRTLNILNNYEICPIVYNVVERLKKEFNK
jgi:Fe-S-cluster containining protein